MEDTNSLSRFTLDKILGQTDYTNRKTKIVCTMGPSCWTVEKIVEMIEKGMTVARLNFSHGDHKTHAEVLGRIREAQKKCRNKQVAILLDTKGPEIRTGILKNHQPVDLEEGQELEITTDYSYEGDNKKIAMSYQGLPKSVKVGSTILCADGTISFKVSKILETGVIVTVVNSAKLGEKKNVNLPGLDVDIPTITEKDEEDIVDFGLKYGVDMIALSFARTAEDIEQVRDLLGPRGSNIKIIAKIENQQGLNNYDDILRVGDGIMVARGDLGMEIPPQKVFVAQKWMIKKANEAGKPVITATQMFESMIKNPRPTRAEASDVANAVLDGTDAVMLSGETANGAFPIEAVETMARICSEAELCFDNENHYWNMQKSSHLGKSDMEAMAASAVQLSFEIKTNAIICFTETGYTARLVSKYAPKAQIVAIGIEDSVIKGLTITRGVIALRVPSFHGIDSLIDYAIKSAKEMGICKSGERVIVIQGLKQENPEDSNLLKIFNVV